MRKQRSSCTISSFENSSVWQASSVGGDNYGNDYYQNFPQSQLLTFDSDAMSNPYEDIFDYNYMAAGDPTAHNYYFQNMEEAQTSTTDYNYSIDDNSWNFSEPLAFKEQTVQDPYSLQTEDGIQDFVEEPLQQLILDYGVPTVTDYGTVALLMRHLIRVDVTPNESVCVNNFPAQSVTALNTAENKCYVKHPNGVVFQAGTAMIHAVSQDDKMFKISGRGITFSSALPSMAYFVDESGTKTTTAKFMDLSKDLTMDILHGSNSRSYEDLGQECYRKVSEGSYRKYQDGSEVWILGGTRIKQDKWGQVIISQNNGRTTISTSATTRRVTVESPSASINIDCYMKNYLTVRKDARVVTCGYCGLIAQNRSQKAGIDRSNKLVLF